MEPPRIYLDLDNTLLHAIPTRLFHKKYKDRASKRKIAEALSNIKVYDMKDDDESYYLRIRMLHKLYRSAIDPICIIRFM